MNNTSARPAFRPDLATLAGLILAFGCILGGLVIEGGKLLDIAQITAGLIVGGGTLGAVLITTPLATFMGAVRNLPSVFLDRSQEHSVSIDEIAHLSGIARKSGITSLEDHTADLTDPFLKKALDLLVDGMDVQSLRDFMQLEILQEELWLESQAKVYEVAGGYAPTIGIIGAVLGLIQVMKHLENIEEVGRGIAVSFVATVYGVSLANLILLPVATKLKARAAKAIQQRELALEGAIAIAEGLNPKLIRLKLEAYLQQQRTSKSAQPSASRTQGDLQHVAQTQAS